MIDFEELMEIDRNGYADVDCSKNCGESGRVEPDGDHPCYNKDCDGRLTSPLILEGLI